MRGRGFRRRSLELVAILLGLTAGCGDGSSPSTAGTPDDNLVLQSFAEDYRMYSISKKHPPRKADDMKVMQSMAMPTAEAIRNGDIIVLWGAELPDLKEEPGQSTAPEILAYGKDVPEAGGYVLHLDRTISQMTPEEFNAAPKAAGEIEEPSESKTKK